MLKENVKYGWIGLYRSMTSHWIYPIGVFTKYEAWIDLLLMVNYEEKKVFNGAGMQSCKKGETITSQLKLMKKWGWSKSKLLKFLKVLKSDQMIDYKATTKKTTIKVLNFHSYQDFEANSKLKKDHRKTIERLEKDYKKTIEELTKRLQKDTNNKDNNINKDNKDNNILAYDFLKLKSPSEIEAFEMNNKKSFHGDFETFVINFNSVVVEKGLEWEINILMARLIRLNANWDKTPKKNESKNNEPTINRQTKSVIESNADWTDKIKNRK